MNTALLLNELAQSSDSLMFWNTVAQVVLAMFTIASFFGLVAYVRWTKKMAETAQASLKASHEMIEETRNARLAEALPYLVLEIEARPGSFIFINLVNYGRTMAKDVVVTTDPPMTVAMAVANDELIPFCSNPPKSLAPGQRIATALGPGYIILDPEKYPQQYHCTIEWSSAIASERQSARLVLNLDSFARVRQGGNGDLHDVARSVEAIARATGDISKRLLEMQAPRPVTPHKRRKAAPKTGGK
jgi:hypothetical protein